MFFFEDRDESVQPPRVEIRKLQNEDGSINAYVAQKIYNPHLLRMIEEAVNSGDGIKNRLLVCTFRNSA